MVEIIPLYDRVLIEPLIDSEVTAGGIVLPETARHKKELGTVRAVGEGYRDPGREDRFANGASVGNMIREYPLVPLRVKVGDQVIFNKFSGADVTVDGKEYKILGEAEILAVVKD